MLWEKFQTPVANLGCGARASKLSSEKVPWEHFSEEKKWEKEAACLAQEGKSVSWLEDRARTVVEILELVSSCTSRVGNLCSHWPWWSCGCSRHRGRWGRRTCCPSPDGPPPGHPVMRKETERNYCMPVPIHLNCHLTAGITVHQRFYHIHEKCFLAI